MPFKDEAQETRAIEGLLEAIIWVTTADDANDGVPKDTAALNKNAVDALFAALMTTLKCMPAPVWAKHKDMLEASLAKVEEARRAKQEKRNQPTGETPAPSPTPTTPLFIVPRSKYQQ